MRIDKWRTVVWEDAFRDSESTKNITLNKFSYDWSGRALQGYGFNPFPIAFRHGEDPDISSRRGIDRSNEVEGQSVEWPGSY